MSRILWTFLVMCSVAVATGILSAKGFYCRDPDTGKLYPVNTSWPSSSFCGSYTCRLRRRNVTDDHKPLRQINVTVIPEAEATANTTNITNETTKEDAKGYYVTIANKTSKAIDTLLHRPCCNKHQGKHNCTNKNINIPLDYINDETNNEKHKKGYRKHPIKTVVWNNNLGNFVEEPIDRSDSITDQSSDGDRYLNPDEIKYLTELLHKMKKSDLETIIEMYNLAQEVYKQIDGVTANNLIGESIKHMPQNKQVERNKLVKYRMKSNGISYWYEPLATPNKLKHPDMPGIEDAVTNPVIMPQFQVPIPARPPLADMTYASTHESPATLPPTPPYKPSTNAYSKVPPVSPFSRPPSSSSFSPSVPTPRPFSFSSYLQSTDFRQLPYYHPMSNFQRYSSYLHNSKQVKSNMVQINSPQAKNPVRTQNYLSQNAVYQNYFKDQTNKRVPTRFYKYLDPPYMWIKSGEQISNPKEGKEQKPKAERLHINPAHNVSQQGPVLHPFTLFNVYNQNPLIPTYLSAAYIAQLPNAILVNRELLEDDKQDIEQEAVTPYPTNNVPMDKVKMSQEEKTPDWQSKPLTKSILEEVKANILGKSKYLPFSLRKKIKVERVGKVKKLDDLARTKRFIEHMRSKRDVTNEEQNGDSTDSKDSLKLYEVYIEKSSCNADTEPGFFRMGNITEPYPACCPQRIGKS